MPNDPREIEAEVLADLGEGRSETVDGDFNGAPELAGVESSLEREAVDVLDAIEGPEAARARDDRTVAAVLEEQVAERREVLLERMPEALAAGLDDSFEAAAAASDPNAGAAPLLADADVLRARLERVDEALAQLEASAEPTGALPPTRD